MLLESLIVMAMLQVYGDFELIAPDHEQLFAYVRTLGGVSATVLLNWGTSELSLDGLVTVPDEATLALRNYSTLAKANTLRGYEGRIYIGKV